MAVDGGQYWGCDLQIKRDWNRVPQTDYECLPRSPDTAAESARRPFRPPGARQMAAGTR